MKFNCDNRSRFYYAILLLASFFILRPTKADAQIIIEKEDMVASGDITFYVGISFSPESIINSVGFDLSTFSFPIDTTVTDTTQDLCPEEDDFLFAPCGFDFPIRLGDSIVISVPRFFAEATFEVDSADILITPFGNAPALRVVWSVRNTLANVVLPITIFNYLTKSGLYAEIVSVFDDEVGQFRNVISILKWSGNTTSVKSEDSSLPVSFALNQNYPNPFNPQTNISFQLPNETKVTLTIYNVLGDRVRTLLAHEARQAGENTALWDGRNDLGNAVPSGVYLYRLQTGGGVNLVRKMTLLK